MVTAILRVRCIVNKVTGCKDGFLLSISYLACYVFGNICRTVAGYNNCSLHRLESICCSLKVQIKNDIYSVSTTKSGLLRNFPNFYNPFIKSKVWFVSTGNNVTNHSLLRMMWIRGLQNKPVVVDVMKETFFAISEATEMVTQIIFFIRCSYMYVYGFRIRPHTTVVYARIRYPYMDTYGWHIYKFIYKLLVL
jgi:hypothetical protein